MNKKILVLVVIFSVLVGNSLLYGSDFNDVLGDVFSAVAEPTTNYKFSPGEKIFSSVGKSLYYSGYEYSGNKKTLLLTYIENNNSIIIKFPEPGLIAVGDVKFRVIEFNNQELKIEKVYR